MIVCGSYSDEKIHQCNRRIEMYKKLTITTLSGVKIRLFNIKEVFFDDCSFLKVRGHLYV